MKHTGIKFENGKVLHCYETPISAQEYKDAVKIAVNGAYGLGGQTCIMSRNILEDIDRRMKYSEHLKKNEMLCKINKVIFNNPATIVIWANGDKTVVKCDGEKFDPEKGLAMAITKYLLGNNQGYYYDIFTKWLPKKEENVEKKKEENVEKKKVDPISKAINRVRMMNIIK